MSPTPTVDQRAPRAAIPILPLSKLHNGQETYISSILPSLDLTNQHIQGVLCTYGIDIDAVAGWLGSYGGEDSTSDISRGLWAGTIGVRRLLKLFEKYNIKTTWFIPGHSLETFPEECAMIRDAGHEMFLSPFPNSSMVCN